ncbi:MAG TPA: c-type cytochrome [Flavobacteriales bacterium]|nr:c-type cytochrome [Flavobacteriales bacterium]HQW42070.1 c-type cytochrome [Flavobacteriales bacterium]
MTSRISSKWIILCLVTLAVGCAKDEGPIFIPKAVVPGEAIDTAYFSTEVLPIFTQHCWTCHPDMGGLDLGANMAFSNLVNVTSTNHAPDLRVVPGDPMASVLWHKVSQSPTYGLTMPPNGTFLTDEELRTIRDWIEQGAYDN